ncbi:TPA: hypothetical protein DCZ39_04080 [Patescibacteria group bacterium]|nr:hypothetical protein [Candidatus Gracilibacteria bacterium]
MKHLLTVDENNPYFNILYTGGQTKNISIRECMDPKTFAFSKDKLFEKFINELKPIIEANNTKEKNEIEANNIKERNDNIEKAVR